MNRILIIAISAIAVLAASPASAASVKSSDGIKSYDGTDFSSAKKKAKKKFCPPGQAKKPGKGSAFKC